MSREKSNKNFWAKFSIAFGFTALFVFGVVIGLIINKPNTDKSPEIIHREMVRSNSESIAPERNCEVIEQVLGNSLAPDSHMNPVVHEYIYRAEIYARLANRGCPENAEKYRNLALRDIEVARALNDDNFEHNREFIEVIETYKKLNMKAEAEKIFEKAKQLTDPAIDFILQVEKIINE